MRENILAELRAAQDKRAERIGPHPITAPRYPVWHLAAGRERRTFMRSRCGRPRVELGA